MFKKVARLLGQIDSPLRTRTINYWKNPKNQAGGVSLKGIMTQTQTNLESGRIPLTLRLEAGEEQPNFQILIFYRGNREAQFEKLLYCCM